MTTGKPTGAWSCAPIWISRRRIPTRPAYRLARIPGIFTGAHFRNDGGG